jgi:hypothetical protein
VQNRQHNFFYPSSLEKEASRCKIYYLPLDYQPKPEPDPKPDWSEKVLTALEQAETYAIGLVATLLATAIVRIIGQHIWGW